ncbi:MAG: hypothetical protein GC150_11400 [Rhizobiales bacterium]|nr:hypothetical protein [Hyphomicrobiales bacterium]
MAAADLPLAECLERMNEMVALRELGTEADMAIGPEAARIQLTPAQLQRIARYLDVEADLAFRCPQMGENELMLLRRTPLPERRPARVATAATPQPSDQPVPGRRPETVAGAPETPTRAEPPSVPEPARSSRTSQPVPTRKPSRT